MASEASAAAAPAAARSDIHSVVDGFIQSAQRESELVAQLKAAGMPVVFRRGVGAAANPKVGDQVIVPAAACVLAKASGNIRQALSPVVHSQHCHRRETARAKC